MTIRPRRVVANNEQVPITVGNPGAMLTFEVWGRPKGMNLPKGLRAAHWQEIDQLLAEGKGLGVTRLEYYISWGIAKPRRNQRVWSVYKRAARKIKEGGYDFIPFIWLLNTPRWAREDRAYIFRRTSYSDSRACPLG
ncbi:MAG: hypothetical protein ACI915_004515 [Gammaproteobacteria bacterium]|jgi:hypothetical protein